MNLRHRQRGIAALTAILVVAIATVLAVNLLWRTSVDLRRTESMLMQDQARQINLGLEEATKYALAEDYRDDGGRSDALDEFWAKPQSFPVDAGKVEGYVQDQQGSFDLNSLVDRAGKRVPETAEQFERLLTLLPLEPRLDPGTARALVDTTIDWIDSNQSPELEGAEDDRYTSRIPPYRPANFWFTSTSELLAVEGYAPAIYAALKPHVTALPPVPGQRWKLNLNTATPEVLSSLVSGVTPDDFGGPEAPARIFDTVAEFKNEYPEFMEIPDAFLDVKTTWFLLTATASIGTVQSTMYSLLERNGEVVRTRLRTFDAN